MSFDFNFNTQTLLAAAAGFAIVITGMIAVLRRYYSAKSRSGLTEKYSGKVWSSPLEARNKYPDVNVFRLQPLMLRASLALTLGLTILLFNWTTFDRSIQLDEDMYVMDTDIEIEPPRTMEPPPPPPPPPPPSVISEIPDNIELETEQVDFVDQSVSEETAIDYTPPPPPKAAKEMAPPPPPPPPPVETDVEEIFRIVEEMPRFPGCEDMTASADEKKACADRKMMEFLYSKLRYPDIARENNVDGTVVIQFVVEKDGTVKNASIIRDIGAGCGEEALRVVNLMNSEGLRWSPGKQRGQPVKVMFILPVKFKLATT